MVGPSVILVTIFSALFGGFIGMVVLRLAWRICKRFSNTDSTVQEFKEPSFDAEVPAMKPRQDNNPYAAPANIGAVAATEYQRQDAAPGYGKAFGISILFVILSNVLGIMVSVLAARFFSVARFFWINQILTYTLAFLLMTVLLKALLPTTWKRALAITAIQAGLVLLLAMLLGLIVAISINLSGAWS